MLAITDCIAELNYQHTVEKLASSKTGFDTLAKRQPCKSQMNVPFPQSSHKLCKSYKNLARENDHNLAKKTL